ncbi:helix-turn-helix transcriptional regulator [Mycobacterium paragordonae]|uniref:ArsR family transcriptional regulator n=1 Tax=Mycobacterium paragordonae TaxID=1389713 RepID=A0AAJ1S8I6_9MYCO|nr:ArsR family transcriptional regulator [Mycobacterium paragordonae]MDP7738382.1 ArsR family transcriptional regulator [Mycobacterium paragordonae]
MAVAGKRRGAPPPVLESQDRSWTFLTNHAHVLLCISMGEELTAREMALRVGITERSVQAILTDLTAEGYLIKSKVGRRNVYDVNRDGRLRHPLEASHTVGELVAALS